MKKLTKWGMLILLILFIGVQFIPKDNNRQLHISKYDIRNLYIIPKNTLKMIEKSCFDCHSNNTDYPWYSKIQPVRYFLDNHIREGKNMLNFSEFGNYSERRKRNKIRSIISQIQEDKMPISTYTIIHREADLSNQDKKIVIDWFNSIK
ncbi:MAG: hypothetical protein COA32_05665 [Fluviicola sp.]|nr:MAG: hypothetical protein COA32_05665 [Fluviicola sp.]